MKCTSIWHKKILLVTGALIALAFPSPSLATDQKDLSVGLKTLPLLNNKISGSATAAIVFDPSNPASKTDADSIKTALDSGLSVPGGATLSALLVPVSDISKLSQAKIAFIAQGTGAHFSTIASAVNGSGILTMSTDLDCVKMGKCVLGVVSSPNVEIYYNKAAGDAANVGFSQAFTMLVKQI